jgi:hypothetical protein
VSGRNWLHVRKKVEKTFANWYQSRCRRAGSGENQWMGGGCIGGGKGEEAREGAEGRRKEK